MNRSKVLALGLLVVAAAPAAAAAELPAPDQASLNYYRSAHQRYRFAAGQPLDGWEDALVAKLAKSSPDRAADSLAPRFGLEPAQMRELVRLWLFAEANMMSGERTPDQDRELRKRFLALLTKSNRSPLVLEAAAATLISHLDCPDAEPFDLLIEGSADRRSDSWRIAEAGRLCAPVIARFARTVPEQALRALIEVATEKWLNAGDSLPLYAYLTSRPALERIDAPHREALAKHMSRQYLGALFGAGLAERGVAFYDSLPASWRAETLDGSKARIEGKADGLPFVVEGGMVGGVRTELAAALALAGRIGEAEALLKDSSELAPERRALECRMKVSPRGMGPECPSDSDRAGPGALLVDHFLHRSSEDPYPIAETFYSEGLFGGGSSGVLAELSCRVFADPGYAALCRAGRNSTRDFIVDAPGSRTEELAAKDVVAAAQIAGYEEARRALASELALVERRADAPDAGRQAYGDRPPVDPEPPAFPASPIPPAKRGRGQAPEWPKSFAPLPDGYRPVRFERSGSRVAAISVSQNYDPTGEVSQGGYWVHLSDDGGRSWRRPLYTGLAEFFPYVVVPNPRLPLLDGDSLDLAVELKLLDTRSISYPPVALATRRSERDLYLRIPIADLERDGDGDGLTDLAERHLLLDGDPPAAGLTPLVVDGRIDGRCSADAARTSEAMQSVLEKIFSVPTGGIIEPVDRPPAQPLEAILAARRDSNSLDRPIFVEGDPADFACLKPDRLMIVYSAADLERLRRKTPDFHAVELNRIIFNRARDRGYLIWSSGWSGGTVRLRLIDGRWRLDDLSQWIT